MVVLDRLLDILAAAAVVLLTLVMISVGTDVILRSTLGYSLTWSLEFSEHSLLGILFLGMPWLAREKGHVTVDLVTDMLPEKLRKPLARLVALVCACLLAYLALWAIRLAMQDYSMDIQTIGIHPIPRFFLPIAVALGLMLTSLTYLREAIFPGRYKMPTNLDPVA